MVNMALSARIKQATATLRREGNFQVDSVARVKAAALVIDALSRNPPGKRGRKPKASGSCPAVPPANRTTPRPKGVYPLFQGKYFTHTSNPDLPGVSNPTAAAGS